MRKHLFLLMIIITHLYSYSQERYSFLSVKTGYSFPVGKFASHDLQNGSFAVTGINVQIEGGWYFLPYLGLGGQTSLNRHRLDLQELAIAKIGADPFLSYLTIRSDPFRTESIAAGIFGKWHLFNRLGADVKILGGMMRAKTPYQLYKPQYFIVGPEYYEITSAVDYGYLFIGGAGLQYDTPACLSLRIEGEYQYSHMTFAFNTASGLRYDEKPVSFVNLVVGLVIRL